jgi:hypothetical protein
MSELLYYYATFFTKILIMIKIMSKKIKLSNGHKLNSSLT